MGRHIHINIGRQIGAGGLEIANELGKRFGIKVYDKELITLAARESGLHNSVFANADEKDNLSLSSGFTFSSFTEAISNAFSNNVMNGSSLFHIQSEVIRKLANEGSTIFVGRCADYILRDYQACLNVFITASIQDRIRRLRETGRIKDADNVPDSKIADLLLKGDRKRASYYGGYSFKTWGAAESYDMCLNSTLLGISGCVSIIEETIKLHLL